MLQLQMLREKLEPMGQKVAWLPARQLRSDEIAIAREGL